MLGNVHTVVSAKQLYFAKVHKCMVCLYGLSFAERLFDENNANFGKAQKNEN